MTERGGLLLLTLLAAGCATPRELAAQLQNAASSHGFPGVTRCWDQTHEALGLRGAYDVTTDFEVGPDGTVRKALVDEVIDATTREPAVGPDVASLRSCIEAALEGSTLSGFSPGRSVAVSGYRFALRDAEGGLGDRAGDEPILVGPRDDRCRGLYAYDPPRDAPALDRALEEAQSEADGADGNDRKARALQRAYDVSLELVARLELELARSDRPEESRDKIRGEVLRVKKRRDELAAQIGCLAP